MLFIFQNGFVNCQKKECPKLTCRKKRKPRKGQCCETCRRKKNNGEDRKCKNIRGKKNSKRRNKKGKKKKNPIKLKHIKMVTT